MKKIISAITLLAVLIGCAASSYKSARENANQVQNGMTLGQASAILGIPPTYLTSEFAEWRRGNAQSYDGSIKGSIRFKLKDGVIIGIPAGGIFSSEAAQQYYDEMDARRNEANIQRAALDAEVSAKKAREAKLRAEAATAAEARLRLLMAEERQAALNSHVSCNDRIMCAKIFALAQIYTSENSDQKIQVATDTIIETYNPTERGRIGIKIIKMPRHGTAEIVSITVTCNEDEFNAVNCSSKRTQIYQGFRPYVEARLVK